MKRGILLLNLVFFCFSSCQDRGPVITMENLLDEFTNLERLVNLPDQHYKTVQFSSYDRRSKSANESGWFANDDGFGNEPIPGFEKVLLQPDSSGIGEYLICDIQQPGVIQRFWTAGINGKIRLFLDNQSQPVYEGNAADLFWKPIEVLTGNQEKMEDQKSFRQFDAAYFPVPFAKACRIEWIGNIEDIHFYHVGIRLYSTEVKVQTFDKRHAEEYMQQLNEVNKILKNTEPLESADNSIRKAQIEIPADSNKTITSIEGTKAIEYFSIKVKAKNLESVLRKNILSIYFDNASIPQVQAPVGDFFGSAPGLNPYLSLPFSVNADSTMTCRFVMPFKHSARIEIENHSDETISISTGIRLKDYHWEDGKTMHFRARWKIDHDLITPNINAETSNVSDITYLKATGQGRLVGAAAFLYNPSNTPTSWGSWWGEGDEKIFVDTDTFPSFFGTGSEDYFNYSWSSPKIFSYPYCGQPRNDGPGNRGYVSNFRWHVFDDIPFNHKLAFYMELGHHGVVPNFSYGRIVYFYSLPGLIDDYQQISMNDIREINYQIWKPEGYLGSAGFGFIQAENLLTKNSTAKVEPGTIWSDGSIVMWTPEHEGERIQFQMNLEEAREKTRIGFTMAHRPDGGKTFVYINGSRVKMDGNDTLCLVEPQQQVLSNHFSELVSLHPGRNEIIFEAVENHRGKKIGIDFVWIKEVGK